MAIKSPNVLFSVILFFVLLIPFLLKIFYIEPFPSIIMPSGHGKFYIKENLIEQAEYNFLVYHNKDSIQIEASDLFPNIPVQYYLPIINNNLGFPQFSHTVDYTIPIEVIFPWKRKTNRKILDLKKYYLNNINVSVDSLKVKKLLVKRNISTGKLIEKIIHDEKCYLLK